MTDFVIYNDGEGCLESTVNMLDDIDFTVFNKLDLKYTGLDRISYAIKNTKEGNHLAFLTAGVAGDLNNILDTIRAVDGEKNGVLFSIYSDEQYPENSTDIPLVHSHLVQTTEYVSSKAIFINNVVVNFMKYLINNINSFEELANVMVTGGHFNFYMKYPSDNFYFNKTIVDLTVLKFTIFFCTFFTLYQIICIT